MTDLNPLTAEMLEASAAGYAAAALAAFERRRGPSAAVSGSGYAAYWRAYFRQRVLELAASVRVNEPALFTRRAAWLRRAAQARQSDDTDLRVVLESLHEALKAEMAEHLAVVAMAPIELALVELDSPLEPDASALDAAVPAGRLALRYLEACLAAEPERATEIVLSALGELSPRQVYVDVLAPAQQEVGRLWHTGEATVIEERLVSETARHLMAIIVHEHAPPTAGGRSVLAASVCGNTHDIGLRLVADLYRLAGWRCVFLGANVPTEQLARALMMFETELVILSATLATQLRDAAAAIDAIRQTSPKVRVLVGGMAFADAPDLWSKIGADGYAASIGDAVAAGEALLEGA